FFIGLDLGQRSDHSAVVILERARHFTGRFDHVNYTRETITRLYLRHAERFPLHFPYLGIPAAIRSTFDKLNPTHYEASPTPKTIVVDATGVGAPIVEILHRAKLPAGIVPITITSGEKPNGNNIPRAALLSNLRILLETKLLLLSPDVAHYDQLYKELAAISVNARARHDDLAFALALAAWSARLTLPLPLGD
ncbi:MAG: hypothetical protein IH602_15645, partial [Bryobacteraceae bacterium]|nr:hypothetical protein [Bryobacteraceae bacterium]